ncbi:hypothetical protein NC16_06485 [Pectobacterium brasiliense]|nr:hypothetical protein NC16_06485 [Pectobacterium brasiliense]
MLASDIIKFNTGLDDWFSIPKVRPPPNGIFNAINKISILIEINKINGIVARLKKNALVPRVTKNKPGGEKFTFLAILRPSKKERKPKKLITKTVFTSG